MHKSKAHLIITDDLFVDQVWTLSAEQSHHFVRVLRLGVGDWVDIADRLKQLHRCMIIAIDPRVVVRSMSVQDEDLCIQAEYSVTLAFALHQQMDIALQKCTELGVDAFIPLMTERTQAHWARKNIQHLERVIQSAAHQSRRRAMPILHPTMALSKIHWSDWTERWYGDETQTIACSTERSTELSPRTVLLLIGPEGGWTRSERYILQQHAKAHRLSCNILRTETACIAMTAVWMNHFLWSAR